jgi:hypothetical protein
VCQFCHLLKGNTPVLSGWSFYHGGPLVCLCIYLPDDDFVEVKTCRRVISDIWLCIIDCAVCWIKYHKISLLCAIWVTLCLQILCLPHSKRISSSTSLSCSAVHIINVHKLQTCFKNLTWCFLSWHWLALEIESQCKELYTVQYIFLYSQCH